MDPPWMSVNDMPDDSRFTTESMRSQALQNCFSIARGTQGNGLTLVSNVQHVQSQDVTSADYLLLHKEC